jgi:hypothetical protein
MEVKLNKMPIPVDEFIQEASNLANRFEEGVELGRSENYHEAIRCLDEAIISAGLLLTRDQQLGRRMRLDKTILVAKGCQIKAYTHMITETDDPQTQMQLVQDAEKIARGRLNRSNPYLNEIIDAMNEWGECEERGDFYTRPLEK